MDSLEIIIKNPDLIDLYGIFPLYNNMTKSLLLKDWTTSQHNCTLIAVVVLEMLYYAQNKHFNIVQKVNTQFAFVNKVPQWFVELFH